MASKLSTNRKFDVVVYGATGFTGSLVAEYFAKEYSATNLKWAIAGRSQSKLQSLKQKLNLGPNVDVLVADAADQKSLDAMAESTKVVLSTTGPFALYGTPLVDACVRSSTNYCDITGESQWIRGIIDGYHDQAAASKLKIVNCCGFDCIPSDLGVMMMVDAMKEQGLEPEEIRYVMKESLGGASGGTIASVMNIFDTASNSTLMQSASPYFLTPRDTTSGRPTEATDEAVATQNKDTYSFLFDKEMGCWEMPWIMQSIDTRIVARSNALFGWRYGRNLVYRELMAAPNVVAAAFTSFVFPLVGLLLYFPFTRALVKRIVPKPGEGPNQYLLDNGFFKVSFWGRGKRASTGQTEVVRGGVTAMNGDPGYRTTSKFIAEAAVALALDDKALPPTYGVLTPSVAMGNVLLNRLRNKGVDFYVQK